MTSPLARSTSSISSTDMEALFAKIHKDQASQLELLKHTKRAMDRTIASKDSSDIGGPSTASLSFEILGELLEEIVLDVVSEAHRDVKNMRSICSVCKTKCRSYVIRAGLDIFGQNPQANNSQTYDCVHCQRSFPAQRYAPHLEKCLGLSGRSSSRAASRRMGAGERAGSGSPFTPVSYSDERDASDSDKDLIEKKRKKNASSTNGSQTNGGSGSSLNGSDYGASNLIKSSSSNASKAKKQKSDSSDYPLKTQKSSLLAKASKGSSSSKLKGLGLHTPSSVSVTPVGEISLGYLDDDLLLANGKSLQNGAGSNSNVNNILSNGGNNSINSNGSASQKLSSSNSKRGSGGISSSKRPPGSGSGSGSSKNGQVALSSSSSFFERLKAIGSRDGASDSSGSDDDSHDGDYRKESGAREKKEKEKSGNRGKGSSYAGSAGTSSQPLPPVVIRLKKASAFTGHGSDSVDTDFIDIDGDGDEDSMDIMPAPKKKKP